MLAKWFRLRRWIRAAILYPAFVAVVFGLDIVFHIQPTLPHVVFLPLIIVILAACLSGHRREEDLDARKGKYPGA